MTRIAMSKRTTIRGWARSTAGAMAAVIIAAATAGAQQATQQQPPPAPQRQVAPAPVAPPPSARPPASRPLLPPSRRTPTPDTVKPMQSVPGGGAAGRLARAPQARSANAARPAPTLAPAAAPPRPVANAVSVARRPAVNAAEAPPAGATMRCKDGTYLFGAASEDRCAGNGGLAIVLQREPQQPPAPPRKRP